MLKDLLAKIIALGTKKAIAVCVAGVVAVGTVAGGTYVIIDKINTQKQETEQEAISQDEVKQTVQYEAENVILEGKGLEEEYTLEIKYFEADTDEYQRAFNSINGATTPVTALEVLEIKMLDKEGKEVEIEQEVDLKIVLKDETKKASGEYLLWDSELITIKNAHFDESKVEFTIDKLGVFVISKNEEVEVDESQLDKDLEVEPEENTETNKSNSSDSSSSNNTNNNTSSGNSNGNTTTTTPNQPEPTTPSEPQYKTIQLNVVTTYCGLQGYFTIDDNTYNYDLVSKGLTENNDYVRAGVSEYYDIDSNHILMFIFNSPGTEYLNIRNHVDDGPGRGSTPVKVTY